MSKDYKSIEERQSFVVKKGKELEDQVVNFLTEKLSQHGIKILHEKELNKHPKLIEYLSIPTKESKSKNAWGDIDIVVVDNDNYPIAIISCKRSFHGRITETFFYSVLFRMLTRIKFVLVTADAGRGQTDWQSELGSEDKPTKDREMASTFLDGLYTTNDRTERGGIVKHINELPNDILYWKQGLIKTQPKW